MPRDVKPDFRLSIENLFFQYQTGLDETIFVFSALLVNRGAPSVALSWEASLTVNDATVMMTRFCLLGDWVLSQGAQDVTIQPGRFRVEVSLKDYLETKTSAVFGQETHVVNGPLPMYAHERSTVKDPEPGVPFAPVGPTTIQ